MVLKRKSAFNFVGQTRSLFLRCMLLMLVASLSAHSWAGNMDPDKPNVIIFYYDDLGFSDIGAYDTTQTSLTPNLDTLSAEGMSFTAGHSSAAVCTPSRYSIIAGRYSWRTSRKANVTGGYSSPLMEADRFTIGKMFQSLGYHTSMVGKWHVGMQFFNRNGQGVNLNNDPNVLGNQVNSITDDKIDFSRPLERTPTSNGFDYFFGTSASLDMPPYAWIENQTVLFKGAIVEGDNVDFSQATPATNSDLLEGRPLGSFGGFVRNGVYDPNFLVFDYMQVQAQKVADILADRADDDQPFFIYVPFPAPHTPLALQERFRGVTDHTYGDYMVQTDYYAGVILDALADPDGNAQTNDSLVDNTVVFMTSDNGPSRGQYQQGLAVGRDSNGPFRGIKRDVWEGGTRVPFVVRWPGKVEPGSEASEALWQGDFFATMAEYLEYDLLPSEAPDSESFLSVLLGFPMPNDRREGFIEHAFLAQHAIVDKDGVWKLIDGTGSGSGGNGNSNIVSYDENNNVITNPSGAVRGTPRQLFNLAVDPGESNNLLRGSVTADSRDKEDELYALLNNIRGNATEGRDGDSSVPSTDNDNDGIPNFFEEFYAGLSANDGSDANTDLDNDGLTNAQEYRALTNPNNADTDGDGVSDGVEVQNGTDPREGTSIQPAPQPETVVLALYDGSTAVDGNFNTTAFDSVDVEPATAASRLSQGGSLDGGGAAMFVLDRSHLATSASGIPAFNFGSVTTANRNAAIQAGDFLNFTLNSNGADVLYESLSFYHNQNGSAARIDVSYTIDGNETFVLQNFVPRQRDANVIRRNIDFPDFTSNRDVTWTFYLYGASSSVQGTRLDDIELLGQVEQALPSTSIIARYDMEAGAAGNFNFNTAAFDSSDTETITSANRLTQGGSLTGGGAVSFVVESDRFASGPSGASSLNLGSVTTANRNTARQAGDFFSFLVVPNSANIQYESLSFYGNQHGAGARVDVSYTVNGVETFILQNHLLEERNGDGPLTTIDFPDVTTNLNTTWTFYLYDASNLNFGSRFDDIELRGVVSPGQ